jgi:hypothetical protein
VTVKGCQKEEPDHCIQSRLDNSEAADIVVKRERLDDLHRCLDVERPQKVVVDY